MKILRYENRKEPIWYLDASTPEKEAAALKCLFLHLKNDWHCYEHLADVDNEIAKLEQQSQELRVLQQELAQGKVSGLLRVAAEGQVKGLEYLSRQINELKWQKEDWDKVKSGNPKALKRFLESRSRYEYEEWEFIDMDDPIEYLKEHFEDELG